MPTQTDLIVTITPTTKEAEFSGSTVIAVRETVDVTLYGFGSASAADLIFGFVRNGVLCAFVDDFTDEGDYYSGSLDLNTEEMVDAMDGTRGKQTRVFEVFCWDTANSDLLVNDSIKVQNNPYSSSMADPTLVGGIGEVYTLAEKTKLSGIEEEADGTYYATVTTATILTLQGQSHQVIMANTTGGSFAVTLPTATGFTGSITIIKPVSANTLTITPAGAETINGEAGSQTLNSAYTCYRLFAFGGNWICPINANP
jgi:hypothetical protein